MGALREELRGHEGQRDGVAPNAQSFNVPHRVRCEALQRHRGVHSQAEERNLVVSTSFRSKAYPLTKSAQGRLN